MIQSPLPSHSDWWPLTRMGEKCLKKKPKNFQYAAEEEEKNVQVFPSGIKGLTWIESNWRIVGFWKRRRRKQVSLFSAYSSPSRYIPVSSWHLLAKPTTTRRKSVRFPRPHKILQQKNSVQAFFFGLYWLYVNSTMRGQWRRCFRSVNQFVRITRLISSRHPHLVLFIPSILTRSDTLNTWEIIGFQRRRKDILSIESPPPWWPVDIMRLTAFQVLLNGPTK